MKAEAPIGCRGEVPRLGTGLPSIVGAGFILPAGVCVAAGSAGRCKHRPLQRFAVRQGCRFPAGRGPSVDRRGGIYPARGCLRRRGVPGPIWNRPLQRFAIPQTARFPGRYGPSVDCRGGIYPARGLAATQGPRDDLRPKSRACGPVGLRNAPAGAVRASSPTGAVIPQPAVFPPFGPGVCAAARSFQSSVFLRRPRLRGRFCFAWVCAAGGRHIVGQGARGTMCARCPKTGRFAARAANLPACPAVPGDAAAPRRYNGGKPGTPCVSQRGGHPLYQ